MYIAKIIYINCKLIHVNYQLIVKHFDIDVSNVKKKSYLKILCYVWLLFTKTEKLEFLWWEIQLRRLSFWKTMALKRKWWRLLTEVKEWISFSKLFSRDSKMISSNEALKSQWPNKERNFGKAGPRWIDILEWHKYKVKLLDQKNRSKNESVKLIQNFPFYPSWNASHTK